MSNSLSLGEIAARFNCQLAGDPDLRVTRVGTLAGAGPEQIGFLANRQYKTQLAETRAGAVILAEADAADCPVPAVIAADPYLVYARVATVLHPPPPPVPGVHAAAHVSPDASLGAGVSVAPGAVIEAGARLGARVQIGPGCVVGAGAVLGEDVRLVANVTLCAGVTLGARVLIHPNTVIGSDGFGLARGPEGWEKVPQVGSVRLGNDVEIGAGTTIDRGAIEDTVLEDGVKLDNQIQVAHNVHIGEHTVIAACTGISGSTRIGRRCMIAGAVGFVGHLDIADDVVITGQTMVNKSISKAGVYSSALPMDEASRWRKNSARFRRLDDIARRVAALEKRDKRTDLKGQDDG